MSVIMREFEAEPEKDQSDKDYDDCYCMLFVFGGKKTDEDAERAVGSAIRTISDYENWCVFRD